MSWSVSASQKSPYDLVDYLNSSFRQAYPDSAGLVKEQFEVSKEAVDRLMQVVDGEYYNCSIGGHSQTSMQGSSPDSIVISISATTPPALAEPSQL